MFILFLFCRVQGKTPLIKSLFPGLRLTDVPSMRTVVHIHFVRGDAAKNRDIGILKRERI